MQSKKTALITGSTQGIGRAIAERLVANGFNVIIHCSKDLDKAERVKEEIKAYKAVVCDLYDKNAAKELYKKTGGVDVLILNASVQIKKLWTDVNTEDIDKQIQINFTSSFQMMQQYYPYMKSKGWGRIIVIGSVNQHRRHKELSIYAATKCALMSVVENVAKEVAAFGITVNNISPGAIDTPRNESVMQNEELKKKVEALIPLGRFGRADECAGIAALLASEESSYITGADFKVDGGMSL